MILGDLANETILMLLPCINVLLTIDLGFGIISRHLTGRLVLNSIPVRVSVDSGARSVGPPIMV